MTSVRSMVNDFARKLNTFNTGQGSSLQPLDVASVLNEAYKIVYEKYVNRAEIDRRYHNAIKEMEVKEHPLTIEKVNENVYLAKYPKNMYKRLGHYAKVSCPECKEGKIIVPHIVQTDDLHLSRKDIYRKANYSWRQLPISEAGEGIYIYTDKALKVDEFYIDYYKKITLMEVPSLEVCNGGEYYDSDNKLISQDINFEIQNSYLSRIVVDIAILLATTDVKDQERFTLNLNRITNIENIT